MQDETSDALLASTTSPPPPQQGMGSRDARRHGFSAHDEPTPDCSGYKGIGERCESQCQSEDTARRSREQQKMSAEHQAAADEGMEHSASHHLCKTCDAIFQSRNALMKHVKNRKHHERKGEPGQGAKKRRRERRESKQRAAALALRVALPAAAEMPPPSSGASKGMRAESPMALAGATLGVRSPEHPWGDWDPMDNPAISHGYTSRAGYEAAKRAEHPAADRVQQPRLADREGELPDYSDVASDG
jgi:hypothetical protein